MACRKNPKKYISAYGTLTAEQFETDVASAHETFADASAGIHNIRGELKSLVDKVEKGEARTCPPVLRTAALRC